MMEQLLRHGQRVVVNGSEMRSMVPGHDRCKFLLRNWKSQTYFETS